MIYVACNKWLIIMKSLRYALYVVYFSHFPSHDDIWPLRMCINLLILRISSIIYQPMDPLLSPSLRRPLSNPMLATVTVHRRPVKLSAEANVLKLWSYGTCKSDSWYPKCLGGGDKFFTFHKLKSQEEKCGTFDAMAFGIASIHIHSGKLSRCESLTGVATV